MPKPKPETEPDLRGIVGNRSKPGKPETGSKVQDYRPASQKTGPGLEARYRITGRPAGKPDWDRKLDTGYPAGRWKTGPGPEAGYQITGWPAGKPDWDQKPYTG